MLRRGIQRAGILFVTLALCLAVTEGIFALLNLSHPPLNFWNRQTRVALSLAEAPLSARSMALPTSAYGAPDLTPNPVLVRERQRDGEVNASILPPHFAPLRWYPLRANVHWRSRLAVRASGATVYDVPLSTDSFGRRQTFRANEQPKSFLAVFGCSYVFGIGVGDNDTLPSAIAKNAPATAVLNYGVPGGSPVEALGWLESDAFSRGTPDLPGRALYVVMHDHIRRIGKSLARFPWFSEPSYEEGPGGELVRVPSLAAAHPFLNFVYPFLERSQTLGFFRIDVPSVIGNERVRLLALMLKGMSDDWARKYGNRDFTVVLWPDNNMQTPVIGAYLDYYRVPYLNYGPLPLEKKIRGPVQVSEYDPHPSAAAHAFIGRQIARDLGLR